MSNQSNETNQSTAFGKPAMLLCWSHAEYLSLVQSRKNGVIFDRIEPAFQRYVKKKIKRKIETWTLAHRLKQILPGKTLRIVTAHSAKIQWSADQWSTSVFQEAKDTGLGCWFADLPTSKLSAGSDIKFAIQFSGHWKDKEFEVSIRQSDPSTGNRTDSSS